VGLQLGLNKKSGPCRIARHGFGIIPADWIDKNIRFELIAGSH
jgi:hypothetical protein